MAKSVDLERIREEALACRRCPLCDGRTNVVFGAGSSDARIMVVGEAPGRKEDEAGEPFVGSSGKYLSELLAIAGLSRDDVYIANVVKCRPPSNRNPKPEEIQACAPYLRDQVRAVDPDYIVTLGNFSTRFILRTEVGITEVRGRVHDTGRFKVFPVFHPAAAIYDRAKRPILEEDFATLGGLLRA